MTELPDLSQLAHEDEDALIRALWAQVQALAARVAELEARLGAPPKTPGNSSLPPSKGRKPNRPEKGERRGPRPGSLGRMGGGRALAATPGEIVSARPVQCAHCQAALDEADHVPHGRCDKVGLPQAAPVATRVGHYAGRLPLLRGRGACAGAGGPGAGHAVQRGHCGFGHAPALRARDQLPTAEPAVRPGDAAGCSRIRQRGALDAAFRRGKLHVDAEVASILARLRCARVACSDEASVCINGRTCWNRVFPAGTLVPVGTARW